MRVEAVGREPEIGVAVGLLDGRSLGGDDLPLGPAVGREAGVGHVDVPEAPRAGAGPGGAAVEQDEGARDVLVEERVGEREAAEARAEDQVCAGRHAAGRPPSPPAPAPNRTPATAPPRAGAVAAATTCDSTKQPRKIASRSATRGAG